MIFIQIIIEVLLQIVTIRVDIPRRKIFMKKLFLTTIISALLSCVQVNATMISVDYIGETYVTSNNIERSLIVNSDDGGSYNIAIRPLEEEIIGSDGKTTIPLEYLFFNNTKEDVYVRYNEYSNLFFGTEMDGVPRNVVAKIKEYGVVPAGTYTITLEVQATNVETDEIAATINFPLQFIVHPVHQITTYAESPKITLNANTVFAKNKRIANDNSPVVYIRSNTNWILLLDTKNFEETREKWYVRTTSGTGKVTSRLQEPALIIPGGSEIILARGVAPADNEQVTVEFSIENPQEGALDAGEYPFRIKYILREGEAE